jgi:hypothetical protein
MQDNLRIEQEKTRQSSSNDKKLFSMLCSKENNRLKIAASSHKYAHRRSPYLIIPSYANPSQPSRQPTDQPRSTSYRLRGST